MIQFLCLIFVCYIGVIVFFMIKTLILENKIEDMMDDE